MPNGIDVDAWRIPHVAGDPDDVRLVAVMRLAPRKRTMPLVQMVEDASRQLPPGRRVRLTLVGDGPVAAQVRRRIERHGLSYGSCIVDLAGRLTPEQVRATLGASDAFIAPARLESFGIAALEARTAGLPVLAYTGTGIATFVRDEQEGPRGRRRGDDRRDRPDRERRRPPPADRHPQPHDRPGRVLAARACHGRAAYARARDLAARIPT